MPRVAIAGALESAVGLPEIDRARPRVFAALAIVPSCGQDRCAIGRWGVHSWMPVAAERVLLFVLAGRRFGDEWRFVRRVSIDRVAGRG